MAVVEADDREVLRLFDADGGERVQRSPSPVTTNTRLSGCASARSSPTVGVQPICSFGGFVPSAFAIVRHHHVRPWDGYAERLIGSIRREATPYI